MRFLATFFLALSTSASALDFETEARLKMALEIAREHNDTDLVKEVTAAATAIKSSADAAKSESLKGSRPTARRTTYREDGTIVD